MPKRVFRIFDHSLGASAIGGKRPDRGHQGLGDPPAGGQLLVAAAGRRPGCAAGGGAGAVDRCARRRALALRAGSGAVHLGRHRSGCRRRAGERQRRLPDALLVCRADYPDTGHRQSGCPAGGSLARQGAGAAVDGRADLLPRVLGDRVCADRCAGPDCHASPFRADRQSRAGRDQSGHARCRHP